MGKLNLSILLVEDDRLSLFVYAEFIRNIVKDVYTATDGREGVEVYKQNRPDIIVTDIMMPKLDGLEMIREIKKIEPNIKVIMISGHSEADYFIRSIDLGVDGYLLKPVDNKRLKNKINELGKNILLSQKVAETEKKFQDFAALLPQIVFETDLNGKFTFVNQLALKKFGYTKEEIAKGLYLKDVISSEYEKSQSDIEEIVLTGMNYHEEEVVCISKNGEQFPSLIYTSSIFEDDQLNGIRGVVVDISARKEMMEELKSLNQELEEKVKDRTQLLSNEIREKEKAEQALIKAKEKAEESDELKGIFLANVSHEIQTPIKAIISFSNLLQSPNLDEKRRQEMMSVIDGNSNALLNLTNDILEFTRLQSNTVKLFSISFELNLFLEELFPVFDNLKSKALEKDITLRLNQDKNGEEIIISSDPSRLRQIFTNLITNAFKFTHKGFVEYGYKRTEKNAILCYVKDTGLGISKEYQRKIFDRFIQEPKPLNIKKEGTGLGLAITQSLIKMLGGKIWVESKTGEGSTFFFEIPDIVSKTAEDDPFEKYQWKDKQVLIIEDNIKDYISLEEILKNKLKIHYLDNVEQALEFCNTDIRIHLCLIKWSEKSSFDLIKKIREYKNDQPLIAMLDDGFPEKALPDLQSVFDGIISKPFKAEEVMLVLDQHLK
jgi:PAS domain S-box-containing protein